MLTPEQRGDLPLYSWYDAPGYMRWYFRVSHPCQIPLPIGDPPRPCEIEAFIEEDAERGGISGWLMGQGGCD
ncbi:hypothetical protein A2U01_0069905 [Trifolium medium]|uniref:Uncharacterized protein n=1 Tax=Trifolium medium TaxID=97028 RepID=A0A392SJP5_9FABA|nr:hypothetical protein [Trifolium medium]